jgi:hypothetical protein
MLSHPPGFVLLQQTSIESLLHINIFKVEAASKKNILQRNDFILASTFLYQAFRWNKRQRKLSKPLIL